MEKKPIKIKQFIEQVEKDNKITVKELSEAIGRHPKTLSHSLRNQYMSVDDLARVLKVIGSKLIIIYDNHKQEIEIGTLKESDNEKSL